MLSPALLALAAAMPPAFLDAPNRVTVSVEPMTVAEARDAFAVRVGQDVRAVAEVEPIGRPARLGARDPRRVVIAGSFQDELGGGEWDPDGEETEMTAVREGVYELVVALPRGRYEYKVARGGNWNENWGANFERGSGNIGLEITRDKAVVKFVVDFNAGTVLDSVRNPDRVTAPATAPTKATPTDRRYRAFRLRLNHPIESRHVTTPMQLITGTVARPLVPRDFLDQPAFRYTGEDLGSRHSKQSTTFKVWSPTSDRAWVLLWDRAVGGTARAVPMRRGTAGVWHLTLPGDHHGQYYTYRFETDGALREAADINGYAANQPLTRTMVVDLKRTYPAGWPSQTTTPHRHKTDAVIYELHVRDFTIQKESGVRPEWRGKYLGFTQAGTRSPGGNPTGLDYLKRSGVTDLHILPMQSFQFEPYSWGYATTLFNVPEEQYSTTPNDPVNTIREVRQMIQTLHRNGMRVILDVVYNHTWPPEGPGSHFEQTVPYFYFRTNEAGQLLNESGVGNAMADERWMARKFVEDSLEFWSREYRVDGYRFDLLGMHQPESVRSWVKAIQRIDPDSVIYGEPWTGGGPTYFPKTAQQNVGIAVFNDRIRSAFRGSNRGNDGGWMHGVNTSRQDLELSLQGYLAELGARGFTAHPTETVNYVSAHDDNTLWDKATLAMPNASEAQKERTVRLGTAAVLFSQGVPFIEGGIELGRVKQMNPNSYDAGDLINQYDWARGDRFQPLARYFEGLVRIRRNHPAFRLATAEQVRRHVRVWPESRTSANVLVAELDGRAVGDRWGQILIVLHNGNSPRSFALPAGNWNQAVDGERAVDGVLRRASGTVTLSPLSANLYWR